MQNSPLIGHASCARAILSLGILLAVLASDTQAAAADSAPAQSVRISNFLRGAPCGIAWVVDDSAAFVMDTGAPYVAGTAAADDSYHFQRFEHGGATVEFSWGRRGDAVVGRFTADKPVTLDLSLSSGWPGWTTTFSASPAGATGIAHATRGDVTWTLRTAPAPTAMNPKAVSIAISPTAPVHVVAGLGTLPDIAAVDTLLTQAHAAYDATRPAAAGDWGDFIGAIADNMNNSRLYSSDNHMLAHSVSRRWAQTPNGSPYFCWDSFFTANLAALDDPAIAHATIRAILSCQSAAGLVPNFGHWNNGASMDRSQPPMGSLCAWKIHQRYLDDHDFLAEIYPKLLLWHDWWPKRRDGLHDGLLEWGTATGDFQNAQYETGWDDNLHFAGVGMRGATMDAYAIDLSSMWSMDAEYLALIADYLGHTQDAARMRADHAAMNQRINERLWNDRLHLYCSRYWTGAGAGAPLDPSAFGSGFTGEFFSDAAFKTPVATQHATAIDFNWHGASPLAGVPANHWSVRWTSVLTPPQTGTYRFTAAADDGVRVFLDGKLVINDWSEHGARPNAAEVPLIKDTPVALVVEYFQGAGGSELHFAVGLLPAPDSQGDFLTRLTPMNFYPLIAGAADPQRAVQVMAVLTDPKKFWGQYLLPTLAYDDPEYPHQQYWRGVVWGPVNYIVWQGLKKYATPQQLVTYADRNVGLFMKNWQAKGVCGENYQSTDGVQASDPHYTWGALLNLIGLESIVDVDEYGMVVLNGAQIKTITLRHIPLLGLFYEVRTSPGKAELIRDGTTILTAKGTIVRADIR